MASGQTPGCQHKQDVTDSHKSPCSRCPEIEREYRKICKENNLFVIHTTRSILTAKKADKCKKVCRERIEKHVAALRNTDGGELLIHIEGQEQDDRCLEFLDEFITKRLSELTCDGSCYVDNYVRHWLSDLEDFQQVGDFLILKVKKSNGVVTVDFNTRLRRDHETVEPTAINVMSVLFKKGEETLPKIRFGDLQNNNNLLHEDRGREVKAFKPKAEKLQEIESDPEKFADYIWSDLKLKDNFTSMTNVSGGGSYYVGIEEKIVKRQLYNVKQLNISGIQLKIKPEELKSALCQKIESNVLIIQNNTHSHNAKGVFEIKLHEIKNSPNSYVLEVAIGFTDGIVFSDAKGPRTYVIQDGNICRMNIEEWLKRMTTACFMCNKNFD